MEALLETKIFKVSVERLLLNGGQTLYMVGIALLIGTVLGTLLALVLVLCRKGGLVENKVLHSIVSLYINVVRSVPFIILLVTIMPLTRAILGTTIGSTAALVPLVVYISPYLARLIENSLLEVSPGILEAAQAMGATTWQIIRCFLMPEALGSMVLALTTGTVGLLGASAMAGYCGGGGVGDLALTYGYEKMNTPLMIVTVIALVILVQLLQMAGNRVSRRLREQVNPMKKFFALVVSLILILSLTACGGSDSSTDSAPDSGASSADPAAKTEIVYGKSQGPYTELFEAAIVPILEEQGYTLKGVDFSDLLTADIALNDGDVDVNVEQHTAYAENFNSNNNGDLVPISPIPTVPAGIYSGTHTSLDEVTDGAKIAVPNDASNTARAYVLLQKIGWITLDSGVDPSAVTQDDIVENPKNLEFVEMKSLTIPAAIQDFDYVIITGSIVYNAGIDPSAALATEDILDHLILQVVVKEGNKNTDWAQAIVDAYHSDRFKAYLEENNDGLWWVPEELQ